MFLQCAYDGFCANVLFRPNAISHTDLFAKVKGR